MSRIQIRSLTVENCKSLLGQFEIGPFHEGVTVVTGENEAGKSTLVEALRCALFEKHDAKTQVLKNLRPRGTKLTPKVTVCFSVGDTLYTLQKTFLDNPSAELSSDEGQAPQVGHEVEERLRELLDSKKPGRQGAKREHMGVWGLLWVTQDAAARADPGAGLDAEARGGLQDAIASQVGQVLGGRQGELLRTAAEREYLRYWTEKSGAPTGELRELRATCLSAKGRCDEIQAALDAVEENARRAEALGEEIESVQAGRPQLERELEQAQAQAVELERRGGAAEREEARAETLSLQAATAAKELAERQEEARRIEGALAKAGEASETLGDLNEDLAASNESLSSAKEALVSAQESERCQGEAVAGAEVDLAEASRLAEALGKLSRLRDAEEASRALEELEEEFGQALDPALFLELREAQLGIERLDDRLKREGTILELSGEQEARWVLGEGGEVEIPGLGLASVVPASPGLAKAAAQAATSAATFEAALRAAEAKTYEEAQSLREVRIVLESEQSQLQAQLKRSISKVDKTLAGMARAVEKARQAQGGLEADRLKAGQAEGERADAAALLEGTRLDEEAWQELQDLHRELELARVRLEAAGTAVTIEALQETTLAVDEGQPDGLAQGETRTLTLTGRTALSLGDLARLTVVPGGTDPQLAGEAFRQASAACEARLEKLKAADLEAAKALFDAWRKHHARLVKAEEALASLAPKGLAALEQAASRAKEELKGLEERLEELLGVQARLDVLGALLAANKVSAAAFKEVQAQRGAWRVDEERTLALAARVTFPEGEPWLICEAEERELEGNSRLAVTPGEGGLEAAGLLGDARRGLEALLGKAGVADLEAAEERRNAALTLEVKIKSERKRLTSLAPGGLAPLQEECAALPQLADEAQADLAEVEARVQALAEALGPLREERQATRARQDQASQAKDAASEHFTTLQVEVSAKESLAKTLSANAGDAEQALVASRAESSDAALKEERDQKDEAARTQQELATSLRAEVEELSPSLCEGDLERARGVLETSRERELKLSSEQAGLKALFAAAAAKGQFEGLSEATAELDEAEKRLVRLERAARAAQVLWESVGGAYDAAQRKFLAPVVRKAKPYLQALRPGTSITMNADLSLDAVVRKGAKEKFGELSGGTREQLSVIVRLALAQVLAEETRALPLILDDTLGWTDDRRFLDMVKILRHAAKDLQIIVLTCHPERGERFDAKSTIDLDELKRIRLEEAS
ncbi:MAG: AAA family ATPase [Planctomycetes bacterium]|nr:AAA family ATPase [Planctomycetota bacterium]